MPIFGELEMDKQMRYLVKPQLPGAPMPTCAFFARDYYRCTSGLGSIKAAKECALEKEDLEECYTMEKRRIRIEQVLKKRAELVKEGTYTIPKGPMDIKS